jgi:hypothetical protein
MSPAHDLKYRVYVDDNFHYMEESERYLAGSFDDCQKAIEKCKEIVDSCLLHEYKQDMAAGELLARYKSFGEDPWISTSDKKCKFSAWSYAEQRSKEICAVGR